MYHCFHLLLKYLCILILNYFYPLLYSLIFLILLDLLNLLILLYFLIFYSLIYWILLVMNIPNLYNLYYYRFLKSELDGIKSDKSPDFCKKLNTLHDHIGKCLSTNTSNLFSFHDTVENFDNFVEDLRQKSITPEKRIIWIILGSVTRK